MNYDNIIWHVANACFLLGGLFVLAGAWIYLAKAITESRFAAHKKRIRAIAAHRIRRDDLQNYINATNTSHT